MRKSIALLLVAAIFIPLSASAVQEEEMSPGSSRIITDVWNREVAVPSEVVSIAAIGPMGPRMAAYLDAVDMLVGAEDSDIRAESARYDYSPVYHDALSALPSVGTGGGNGENNAYPEELIMLQPDVILAGFDAAACDELQRQTGIPVVSIRYRTQGFIDEGFYRSLRIFASVIGAEDRCEEILSYIDSCKADLSERTCDIPDSAKKRAYTGAVTFNGRHGFTFTYVGFPAFDAIGAINVADALLEEQTAEAVERAASSGTAYIGNNGFEVDPEAIIRWDPDVIFLDPGNMDIVEAEYDANPPYFHSLRAVRTGEVYTMPSTNSAGPNITYLLMNAYYAGTVLFPGRFSDIDFREKSEEIMRVMLGEDFLSAMEEDGLYYGRILIGGES